MAESETLLRNRGAATLAPGRPEPPAGEAARGDLDRGRRRTRRLAGGLSAIPAGVVLIGIGTMVLHDVSAVLRVALVLGGLALIYRGGDLLGRCIFGENFEAALWFSLLWLGLVAVAAIAADWLPLAESRDVSQTLTTPTLLRPDLFSAHPLGTDRQGLDILGGIIYGARVSLVVALGAVAIGILLGGMVGIAAGFYRGRTEGAVNVLTDAMLAFPPLILLLAMVAVLQPTVRNVMIALGVLSVPTYIRLSRANTMVFAQREFVLAARALGAKARRIIFRELLPNVALPVVSYAFIVVGALIVAEASLSFLGLSIRRPNPTWGNMIAAGQTDFDRHPHLVFAPGIVLFVTVFALNRVGDKARELWDPRQTRL